MTAFMVFSAIPVHAASYNYTRYQYDKETLACTKSKVSIPLPAKKYTNTGPNAAKAFELSDRSFHPVKITKNGHKMIIHTEYLNPNKFLKSGTYQFQFDKYSHDVRCQVYEWNKKKKKWQTSWIFNTVCVKSYIYLKEQPTMFEYTKNNGGRYKLVFTCSHADTLLYKNNKYFTGLKGHKKKNQMIYNLTVKNKKVKVPYFDFMKGDYYYLAFKNTMK